MSLHPVQTWAQPPFTKTVIRGDKFPEGTESARSSSYGPFMSASEEVACRTNRPPVHAHYHSSAWTWNSETKCGVREARTCFENSGCWFGSRVVCAGFWWRGSRYFATGLRHNIRYRIGSIWSADDPAFMVFQPTARAWVHDSLFAPAGGHGEGIDFNWARMIGTDGWDHRWQQNSLKIFAN